MGNGFFNFWHVQVWAEKFVDNTGKSALKLVNLLSLKVIRLELAKVKLRKLAKSYRRLYCGGQVCAATLENLSTRRSWFTNGMAGRAELDRGRALRAKCNSLSKTTWNHHERRQNNSVENAFQRFALSFVSFFQRKHNFRGRISTFVWRILFEEPRIWTSGFNLRTRVLKSVAATQ